MRDAQGLAPPGMVAAGMAGEPAPAVAPETGARRRRIAPVVLLASLLAAAACYVVPRGFDANQQLSIEDDPSQIAARALDGAFDATVAQREIDAALAAKDADLAQSFVLLADERHVALDPSLKAKVDEIEMLVNSDTTTAVLAALLQRVAMLEALVISMPVPVPPRGAADVLPDLVVATTRAAASLPDPIAVPARNAVQLPEPVPVAPRAADDIRKLIEA